MARLPNPLPSLDAASKELYDEMAARRGRLDGMYVSMFNHPELVKHVSQLGTFLRFEATLPADIRELSILLVAQKLAVGYEWLKHIAPAEAAGLSPEILETIQKEKELGSFSPFYQLVQETVERVLAEQDLPEGLQDSLKETLGLKGVLEIVVLIGFYRMIAAYIKAFDVPLPSGQP